MVIKGISYLFRSPFNPDLKWSSLFPGLAHQILVVCHDCSDPVHPVASGKDPWGFNVPATQSCSLNIRQLEQMLQYNKLLVSNAKRYPECLNTVRCNRCIGATHTQLSFENLWSLESSFVILWHWGWNFRASIFEDLGITCYSLHLQSYGFKADVCVSHC